MAFSAGVYTLPGAALSTGDTVSATDHNQVRNDMATAFNLTWLRNGTATATANIPMGGFKLTGLAAGTTAGDSVRYEQFASPPAIGSGTANTGAFTTLTSSSDATLNGLTVGKGAGAVSTNTAVGASALDANTTGSYNTAVGSQAAYANTTGYESVAVGAQALFGGTTGRNNIAVGYQAMYATNTGNYNTAIGGSALAANTSGTWNFAGSKNSLLVNTTGSYNTAIGGSALSANTTASNNTALGYQAGYSATTGGNNTFLGYQAGYTFNYTGGTGGHTTVGYQAGYSITTGRGNTLVGIQAGYSLTTGSDNTFIGPLTSNSGYYVTTGSKNTILGGYNGNQGGLDIRTSSNYIVLSDGDGNPRGVFDDSGNYLVGMTSASTANTGVGLRSSGLIHAKRADVVANFNRKTTDGIIVELAQDDTVEGNISVSGTTVSYNGGHLARYAQTLGSKDESLVKGTVLSNLDEMNTYTDAEDNVVANEQLNKVKVSEVEGDANVAGVFVNWSYDEQHSVDEINMAMTGDMIIRIAQGTTVQRGDLLMSAGDGTAKPQGDDIVRSKTVAKVTSTNVTCTYEDGSYCVPCVLMAC